MKKKIVSDLKLEGKKVLIRVDFNVPIKDGVITDDTRIKAAIPTIKYVLDHKGRAIVFSHLGRIKEEADLKKNDISICAKHLEKLLGKKVLFINQTRGKELEDACKNLKDGEILMFQNTRYEDLDGKKESKNDPELGKYWASLGDVFVNDAFGTAHRDAASNVGIANNIKESACGFLLEKEIEYIGGAVQNPEHPYVAILGGSKVSDKINVLKELLNKADRILIGGAMMFTFLKAQGYNVGKSLYEEDKLSLANELLEEQKQSGKAKIILPVDVVCNKEFKDEKGTIKLVSEISNDDMGLDVGPKTIELFKENLKDAKLVVWNGPMGVFEMKNYAFGTLGVCEILADLKGVKTIVGGGDSVAAVEQSGLVNKFSHVSTGGGASLEYLEGKDLPGISCIQNK